MTTTSYEIDSLADAIAESAAHIDAAMHTLLGHIRQFDALEGWHRQGALSCAHWLSWRVGLDWGAAREKVRVARRLGELPAIDEALRRGEVSYSKVRAMTRVATADNEHELLDLARSATGAQLEKICRLYGQVQSKTGEEARTADAERWVVSRATDDGMVRIQVQLHADEAALVLRAMASAAEPNRPADGLVAMAERTMRGEETARPPMEVVVHVSADTLQGHTEEGFGISAEVSRRLLCDAGVVPLLEDTMGNTIDVGRKTRTISAALRRALHRRDGGCRFPGCSNKRVDAHHVTHWADGGETSLPNTLSLCALCRARHKAHYADYRIMPTWEDFSDGDANERRGIIRTA